MLIPETAEEQARRLRVHPKSKKGYPIYLGIHSIWKYLMTASVVPSDDLPDWVND